MTKASAATPAPRQTVFKRKRARDFTVLGNAVLFDQRLALDELAAIVKLLAKPHDWQVHPSALRKEWRVGRGVYYRIVNKLIAIGYIARGEMIKDAWGRYVACEYIITDEPEEPPEETGEALEPTDDEIDPAEADEFEVKSNDGESATPVAPLPHAGFPHTGEPHAENRHTEKELRDIQTKPPLPPKPPDRTSDPPAAGGFQSENERSETADPPGGSETVPGDHGQQSSKHRGLSGVPRGPILATVSGTAVSEIPKFEKFRDDYRPEPHMSEAGAQRRWVRLTDQHKIDAVKYLPDFRADRVKRGWKMPDMRRYLMDMHWVPYAKAATEKPKSVAIKAYSAQWHRWREYKIAMGHRIGFFDEYPKRYNGDWHEPSEWPPALPPKDARANPLQMRLRDFFGTEVFDAWFTSVSIGEVEENVVTLSVATEFLASQIRERFSERLLEFLQTENSKVLDVRIDVRGGN